MKIKSVNSFNTYHLIAVLFFVNSSTILGKFPFFILSTSAIRHNENGVAPIRVLIIFYLCFYLFLKFMIFEIIFVKQACFYLIYARLKIELNEFRELTICWAWMWIWTLVKMKIFQVLLQI